MDFPHGLQEVGFFSYGQDFAAKLLEGAIGVERMFGQVFVAFFVAKPPDLVVAGSDNQLVCPVVIAQKDYHASAPRPRFMSLLMKDGLLVVGVPPPEAHNLAIWGFPQFGRAQPQHSISHPLEKGAVALTRGRSVNQEKEGFAGAVIAASVEGPPVNLSEEQGFGVVVGLSRQTRPHQIFG